MRVRKSADEEETARTAREGREQDRGSQKERER